MKLVAILNVKNELGRYLELTVPALLEWVDEIRAQDDGSTDGTFEYLDSLDRVFVKQNDGTSWREHEGEYVTQGFNWALEGEPTHMLAIDGDELVTDGQAVRACVEANPTRLAFTLRMVELWGVDPPVARHDGGWRPHPVGMLWRVPTKRPLGAEWRMKSKALACPRSPSIVLGHQRTGRALDTGVDVRHLGWSNPAERVARAARYDELDGGKYHAKAHLDSILWPDERCDLRPYEDAGVIIHPSYS
jgi:glycosyltransferase involved in cell wall biosynthesis